MEQVNPRISAIVITYNQEDVIERTMDSLLSQDCIYEICVSDDCSTDKTWNILQDYSKRFPGLFKLNRNETNLGIFANEEQTWKMPTGDLVYRIAGDDLCPEGYFAAVVKAIHSNGLDWKNDCFAIVGESLTVYPDGSSHRSRNSSFLPLNNPLKLKLRELFDDRSACFSRSLLERYIPVSKGRSYAVEAAQDFQLEVFCSHFFLIPDSGSVYYAELGVSAHLSREKMLQRVDVYNYLNDFLKSQGVELDLPDSYYLKFRTEFLKYKATHSFPSLINAFCFFICSIDLHLGIRGLELSRFVNSINRKAAAGRR